MDKFFKELFEKIVKLHEDERNISQSFHEFLDSGGELPPEWKVDQRELDLDIARYLWVNKSNLPSA